MKRLLHLHRSRGRSILILALALMFAVSGDTTMAATEEADNLYSARRYVEAIAAYKAVVDSLPLAEQARVYNRIAYSHERKRGRDREAAIAYHRKALAIPEAAPREHSYAYLRIGYNHSLLRDRETALRYYAKVETVDDAPAGHISEARLRSGWASNEIRTLDERIALFESVLEVDDGDPNDKANALRSLGNLYRQRGEIDKAIASYEAVEDIEEVGAHRLRVTRYLIREMRAERDASEAFYIEPYALEPAMDVVVVQWVSRASVTDGKGWLVSSGDGEPVDAGSSIASQLIELGGDAENVVLHQVRFEGLAPGTVYEYEITSGHETRRGRFRSASPPDAPVVFSVYGDTQNQGYMHEPVAQEMAKDEPHFVLHVGDVVDTGSRWLDWKHQFFDPGRPILEISNMVPTRGNHDGGPHFRPLFNRQGYDYHVFQSGDARFYNLASFGPDRRGDGLERQMRWLEEELADCPGKWRIAIFHHPVFHPQAESGWGRDTIVPILIEHDFDLVLVGHHHTYRRYRPVGLEEGQGFIQIVAGGAGGGTSHPGQSPLLVDGKRAFHHTTYRIEGDRLEVFSRDYQGETFDQFVLEKGPDGRYTESVVTPYDDALEINNFYYEFDIHALETTASPGDVAGAFNLSFSPYFNELSGEAHLHIQADADPWQIEPQRVPLADTISVDAIGPQEGNPPRRLPITVTLEYNGVMYESGQFQLLIER